MRKDHTHTQRGFWLILRAPSGFKLGLESEEKVSQTTHQKGTHEGLHKGPKPKTRPQEKTQLTVMTPQDPNTGLTNARLRLTTISHWRTQLASMTTTRLNLTNTGNPNQKSISRTGVAKLRNPSRWKEDSSEKKRRSPSVQEGEPSAQGGEANGTRRRS